jgi:hypothetical protein
MLETHVEIVQIEHKIEYNTATGETIMSKQVSLQQSPHLVIIKKRYEAVHIISYRLLLSSLLFVLTMIPK